MRAFYFFAATPCFALLTLWHWLNKAPPMRDGADFFVVVQSIAHRIRHGSLFDALWAMYWARSYKPVLHPLLDAPFLLAAGGDVRLAVFLIGVSFTAVFLYFLARLLDEIGGEKKVKAAVYLFVSTVPWVVGSGLYPSTEAPTLGAFTAVLLYLLKSREFTDPRASLKLGVALGLAFCFRPVEAALYFLAPVLLTARRAYKNGRLGKNELARTAAGAGLLVFLLFVPYDKLSSAVRFWPTLFLGTAVAAYGFFHARRLSPRPLFFLSALACATIVFFWYYPFASSVVFWATSNMWSQTSKENAQGITLHGFYWKALSAIGGVPLLAMSAAAQVSFRREALSKLSARAGGLYWILLAPLVLGGLTYNADLRYYFFSFIALYATLSALPSPVSKLKTIASTAAVALAVLFQTLWFLAVSLEGPWQYVAHAFEWPLTFVGDPRPSPDDAQTRTLIELLAQRLPNASQSLKPYPVAYVPLHLKEVSSTPFEPFSLTMRARESGRNWAFLVEPAKENLASLGNFLLLGPLEGELDPKAGSDYAAALVAHSKGAAAPIEYVEKDSLTLAPGGINPQATFLLFQLKK